MQRLAFIMKLHPGQRQEYLRRHAEIWPALVTLLNDAGVTDYGIYLDEASNTLFATLKVSDRSKFDALPQQPLMQQWWQYMKDIMEANPDGSPVTVALPEMFYLP